MREIKFRGERVNKKPYYEFYATDNQEWAYGSLFVDNNKHYCIVNDHGGFRSVDEVDPATVGQYTGLRDRKRTKEFPEGQEIYEGDIVQEGRSRGRIVYERDGFKIDWFHNVDSWSETLKYHHCNLEVIGNIYENPELLKEV
ncbi:MAG: YopX family protein [Thermincolia bacterium]